MTNRPFALAALLTSAALASVRAFGEAEPPLPPAVVLPPPVQTVLFPKDLQSVHPRLFVDAAAVAAFREKIKNPVVAPMWSDFLLSIDRAVMPPTPPRMPTSEDEVREIGDRLPKIAFTYLVTRDPQYLEGARKWIAAVVGYPSWAGDQDLGAAHMTFGLALAYDWLYDSLLPAERQAIQGALLRHGRLLLARSATNPGSWWGSAYFQNHCWINHTGIAVAAMALYELRPEEMQGWLDYTRTRFQTTYLHLGIDGGYHEGPAYARYGVTWILYYIEALKSISGEDLGSMPMLRTVTRYFIDTLMPDGRNLANFGDCPPMGWGAIDEPILPWLAAHGKDGHAEWLRQKNRAGFASPPHYSSPFGLLWFDPSIAPKPPDDLPTCGLYPDTGVVTFRSSWKDDAAVIAFHCGPPGGRHIVKDWATFPRAAPTFGHSHPDVNSFLFWSDRQWRIGAPGAYTHDKKTHNENVWMVGGKGQRGSDETWFNPESYFVPGIDQPRLLRVASGPAADYVVGEAAPAYDAACKLGAWRRHLLFVKGESPYVVVYDRLQAAAPQTWTSYLHTYGPLSLAGNKAFQAEGTAPVPEPWDALPATPPLTPTFGTVFGPEGMALAAAPLIVVAHPTEKQEQRGFELTARMAAPSASAWLVTVVGSSQRNASLIASTPAPSLLVGKDQIAWDQDGNVSLNGKPVEGNLIEFP